MYKSATDTAFPLSDCQTLSRRPTPRVSASQASLSVFRAIQVAREARVTKNGAPGGNLGEKSLSVSELAAVAARTRRVAGSIPSSACRRRRTAWQVTAA
jgi:hypothetical protein